VKETCDMEKKTDKTELKESEIMTPLKAKTCYVTACSKQQMHE